MIQKAIIESVSSPTTYKVRIPEINGVKGYIYSTPTDELQDATVCAPPNAIPNYVEGDVVFVAYERGEDPVIIGKLFTTKDDNTFQDIRLNNLSVNGEITVGDTNRNDILNLSGTKENIQEQIDNISSLLESVGDGGGGGSSTIGELDTTATTSQQTSSSESFGGNITLHKISKTGDYSDLLNKPTITTYTAGDGIDITDGVISLDVPYASGNSF